MQTVGQVECNFAAECGRVVMRSVDAVVTACLVDSIDEITCGNAVNNGRVCRAFAGADRQEPEPFDDPPPRPEEARQ
jgi:hypothetical protein